MQPAFLSRLILDPLSRIYALAAGLKIQFMASRARSLPRPVISVGNISMGGSGKTPVTGFLARYFFSRHLWPVILTRGYKARPPACPFLVDSDCSPNQCGDEPLMLCRTLKDKASIVVDPDRFRAGQWAMNSLKPGIFLLDDGFQHTRLSRDLDLVLLTPQDIGLGWNRVFPLGTWRESSKALDRADILLINLWDCSLEKIQEQCRARSLWDRNQVFFFRVAATSLKNMDSGQIRTTLASPYLLVTGLAGPDRVQRSITALMGHQPRKHLRFPDHCAFGPEIMSLIASQAAKQKVKDIVCTAKDAVKIAPQPGLNIWVARSDLHFEQDQQDSFLDLIQKTINN